MAYSPRQVRQLTTRSERELVRASYGDSIGRLSERALKSRIARARRLRDKQRDLLRRQRLAHRRRTGDKQGSARTAQKAKLFEAALSRFTLQQRVLEAAGQTRKKAPSRPRSGGGKGPKPPLPRGSRKASGQAALRQKARSPRMKAMQAHVSSRGRRRQARRDSR
jgi:hypothetical protein